MNECAIIRDLLGPYLDGEAALAVRQQVSDHLASCQACKEEFNELQAIVMAIAKPIDVEVPGTLWDAIENRLDACPPERASLLRVFRPGAGFALAASIAIVFGLGLFALPLMRDRGSQVQAANVDFSMLLDALQVDARGAFDRFLA